jgi:hypothetical protein
LVQFLQPWIENRQLSGRRGFDPAPVMHPQLDDTPHLILDAVIPFLDVTSGGSASASIARSPPLQLATEVSLLGMIGCVCVWLT